MKNILFNIAKYSLILMAGVIICAVSVVYVIVELLATIVGFDTDKWHDRSYHQR